MKLLHLSRGRRDALRSMVAGTQASQASAAAQVLFAAGGKRVLPESLQRAVRRVVEHETSRLVTGVGLLEAGTPALAQAGEQAALRSIVSQSVRAAGRQVLRSVGAAAGAGALIDGGWALVHATIRVKRGTMTGQQAAKHVAQQAGTGAAAAAAGAAAGILVITLTGGVAAPAVFVVGATASLAAKAGLDAWFGKREWQSVRAELEPSGR